MNALTFVEELPSGVKSDLVSLDTELPEDQSTEAKVIL